MTTPADQLRDVLTRLSNDHRRTIGYYGNIQARPGSERAPRRLLSDFGFLNDAQFTYLVPAAAHIERGADQRACTTITLHPYGVREDRQRLTSRSAANRRVTTGAGTSGVVPLAENPLYLVPAGPSTKTLHLVERLIDPRLGPAYHFVISREGDLYVGAALDDTTSASTDLAETTIDVAIETALTISRADHEARSYTTLVELPYTETQLTQLAVLVAKLRTAYAGIPLAVATPGLRVQWPTFAGTTPYNFADEAPASPFFYGAVEAEAFAARVTNQGSFDLATQVFRPLQTTPPVATRAVARTAISNMDTVGEESLALGNYAGLASAERSADMQAMSRNRFFVQRINVANAAADHAGEAAATTQAAGDAAAHPTTASTNTGPHVYDFSTGYWGDGDPF